ncbi:uncharacterized protein LOC124119104 [Haliotis rufescens]|uniref:uncharacterized protein LOC124119104 n=1 Tax=Haliotis rufescens TaxID=6454 RepID=UPI00201EF3DE|nr:uncharacterized protein LOC124119104 [Haliotis rufescens]
MGAAWIEWVNGILWTFCTRQGPIRCRQASCITYNPFTHWCCLNRSSNNTYAKQNGGNYNFIIDGHKALPTEERFWTDLMSSARQWGLLVYEQDFLDTQFDSVTQLHTDVHLAKQWLKEMGNGAAKNGLRIQYCMSYPRHALQSLEIPVVTQARVSRDYHPGDDHWKIGVSSLLAWAIGVAPYKDNFWTSVQPGNTYNASEPNTALLAVVSTLSTGPVGISDMIGGSNKSLIMKSVNADGLILKPSRPATAIDNTIRRMAWGDFEGPDGEVWSTYSDFGGKNKFGIILAAELTGNYTMTPGMAGFQGFPTSMIFPYNNPSKIQPLTDADPITMTGCGTVDFCLFYVSPVLQVQGKKVLVQGELAKWVPMSPQRVTDISIGDDILISLTGAAAETVLPFDLHPRTRRPRHSQLQSTSMPWRMKPYLKPHFNFSYIYGSTNRS